MLRSTSSSTARRILSSSLATSTKTARPRYNAFQALATNSASSQAYFFESLIAASQRSYSSLAEPGSFFPGDSRALKSEAAKIDTDAPLRADIRTMGALLGQIVKDHHGQDIFEKIEELRGLSKDWRTAGAGRNPEKAAEADATFAELSEACSKLTDEEILVIGRAFNFFLSIANAAEGHHRIRRLGLATREEALPDRYDSW
jgi:phosphoenolpyruvate carboxylase